MTTFTMPDYYRPTPKQLKYANTIAMEIRDRLGGAYSANSLAKNYEIDDLKEALRLIKEARK